MTTNQSRRRDAGTEQGSPPRRGQVRAAVRLLRAAWSSEPMKRFRLELLRSFSMPVM